MLSQVTEGECTEHGIAQDGDFLHGTVSFDGERAKRIDDATEVLATTCRRAGDDARLGEDVDNYKDGQIADHESAWRAGEKGARFGLMIPGKPKVGDRSRSWVRR